MKRILFTLVILMLGVVSTLWAQGVTTATLSGQVTDESGAELPGANVVAIHLP